MPIEVGKFQSDSSRPNLIFFAILCVKMSPEGILSRLAKKHVISSYCVVAETLLHVGPNLALTVQGAADMGKCY